jgi:hypothetical protein
MVTPSISLISPQPSLPLRTAFSTTIRLLLPSSISVLPTTIFVDNKTTKKQRMQFNGFLTMPELATGALLNNLGIFWGNRVSPFEFDEISALFLHSTG